MNDNDKNFHQDRNIVEVIEAICNVIPDNYEKQEDLIEQLDDIALIADTIDDSMNKKEIEKHIYACWNNLTQTLNKVMNEIEEGEGWCQTIEDIVTGEVDYALYL